jgi:hypothetical protein
MINYIIEANLMIQAAAAIVIIAFAAVEAVSHRR